MNEKQIAANLATKLVKDLLQQKYCWETARYDTSQKLIQMGIAGEVAREAVENALEDLWPEPKTQLLVVQ